jgi:PadR family transcriptional regulator PadR
MILNVQYKKGVLELCVLSLLSGGDRYGYDVSEYISKRIDISDGTIYPILRKLKEDGMVTTYLSDESGGPPRKYYRLTKLGRERYASEKAEWLGFIDSVKKILEENGNE